MTHKRNKKPAAKPVVEEKKFSFQPAEAKFSVKSKLVLLLIFVSFTVYANTLWNGYVLDDGMVLKNNTLVTQGIKAIPQILTTPRTMGVGLIKNDFYRPLSQVMFAIEYQVFGLNPATGHFFNILTFIGCVLMLFLFLDNFFDHKNVNIAFISALVFAILPIHTDVVDSIKSRDELLCYFFGFLSLNLLISFMKKGKPIVLISGLGCLFLAYISKETVVALLAVIPFLFFLYQNDSKFRAALITGGAIVTTFIFILIRSAVLNKYGVNSGGPVAFIDNALVAAPDAGARIATEILVLGKYLKLMIIPNPLLCNYSFNSIPFASFADPLVWLSIAAYVSLFAAGITRLRRKKDPWAFAIFFYLVMIFLFSNIPFLIGAQMAERFMFFASTGFCLAVGLAVDTWILKPRQGEVKSLMTPKTLMLVIPFVLLLAGTTFARNADWKDNYTLYKTDLLKSPNDCKLCYYLANTIQVEMYPAETDAAAKHAMNTETIGYLRRALELRSGDAAGQAELERVYGDQGMYDSAIVHGLYALKANPGNQKAIIGLANSYSLIGNNSEAVTYFKRYRAANAQDSKELFLHLAACYKKMNSYDSAILYFNKALVIDPGSLTILDDMGNIYLDTKDYGGAETCFKKVLAKKPNDPDGINGLGCVFFNKKEYPSAIALYKRSVDLEPNSSKVYSNLGRTYFVNGQFQAAINVFFKEPHNEGDLNFIALSFKNLGKKDSARKYEALAQKNNPDFRL